jgi:hypothetical protein
MKVVLRSFPLALTAALLFTGCANIGPPEAPSLHLAKPPSDLRATRQGDTVTLSWTVPTLTTDRQSIQGFGPTRICRASPPELLKDCGTPVGEASPQPPPKKSGQKVSASYTDKLPSAMESDDPTSFLSYAVEVLNNEGRAAGLSNQVHVLRVRTLRPPNELTAQVTSQGVVVSWTNTAPTISSEGLRYVYRVYRRQEGNQQPSRVGDVAAGGERNLTLTDANIEWQKTYDYRVQAVTVIPQDHQPNLEVAGNDSPKIKVFADDVFPPTVPSGLQAAFSGPGQRLFVDLIWAPNSDVDLAGYNVYRHEEGAEPVKLNRDLVRSPAYRDAQVASGKTYSYSVSAVDQRGNESARSEESSETVR